MAVGFENREHIAIITIDRPEARNAIDRETDQALAGAWRRFREDAELWVAVLTGAGDQAFCAGADLRGVGEFYRSLTSAERLARAGVEPGLGGLTRNLPLWKPVIAAVNGYCLAGGFELALACDIRIAADTASFGLPEVTWGIMPGAGGTQRLPRIAPLGAALEMILTGERIAAAEAHRLGIVNRVVPQSELMPAALALAERICRNGPVAVRAAKEAVYRGLHLALDEALRLEQLLAEPVRQSEDAQEGPRAFMEKRPPRFKGR
ncbi:MAG: enoyl-CoA hydratase/isomerase family protein [Deltaproteobacteria bacterium]|nr:enoyl-CoA hydratase/isomerase family protein [Deltaproteobacteria bacterium]